jgi:hypothetical protein
MNVSNVKQLLCHSFPDKVEVDLNVFSPRMEDWIFLQVFGANIITPQVSNWRMRDS